MAKISVIIAAYNSEKYIEECLESAAAQTMRDIEIIVVDDASQDATGDIIKQAAEQDERIHYVCHEKNRSVMQARKTGFEHSTGDYILFVDSDDMLAPDACEKAYNAIRSQDTDILGFGVKMFSQDDERYKKELCSAENTVGGHTEPLRTKSPFGLAGEKEFARVSRSVWDKIYKREIVQKSNENLPDEYLNMAEDWLFSYFVFYYSHSYGYLPEKLYRYRIGTGISTTAALTRKKIDALAKMYRIYNYLLSWTQANGGIAECTPLLERMRRSWLADLAVNFLHSCAAQDREYFVEKVLEHCPKNTFFAALFNVVYEKKAADSGELARACAELNILQTKKTQAKTIGTFYPRLRNGGIENVMAKLAALWTQHGYRVVVFTGEEPQTEDYPLAEGVTRVVIPTMTVRSLDAFEERMGLWEKYIEEYGIDIMVYHAWQDPLMPADCVMLKAAGIPLIMHTHGLFCVNYINTNMTYVYNNAQLSCYYKIPDLIVALSQTDEAWWNACGLRCVSTMNPSGLTLSVKPAPLSGKEILFVGRIAQEKQIFDLLRIMELVREKEPNAKLTIVGTSDDAEYEKDVRDEIKRAHLENTVVLAGYHKEMQPFYSRAAVQLCTSRFEGQSLAISEGRISGLPLVTYELPNSDFIREGEGMFVVRQNDIQGAAEAIVMLLGDDAQRKEMGRKARESAERAFKEDTAEHWDEIFAEALRKKQPEKMLCERTPIETAIGLVNEYTAQGLRIREGNSVFTDDALYFQQQCNALNDTIEELRNSASYRLGSKLLSIPRKLKNMLKRK